MRERSSAYKEKEKVSPVCLPISSSTSLLLSSRAGNDGHVPAAGEAKIRIMLTGRQRTLLLHRLCMDSQLSPIVLLPLLNMVVHPVGMTYPYHWVSPCPCGGRGRVVRRRNLVRHSMQSVRIDLLLGDWNHRSIYIAGLLINPAADDGSIIQALGYCTVIEP